MNYPKRIKTFIYYFLLILCLIAFLFPFYWMFITSLKNEGLINIYPPAFVFRPTVNNYFQLFVKTDFLKCLLNSLIITLTAVIGALFVGLPAGYSISKYHKPERIIFVYLFARILPAVIYLLPLFIVYRKLNIIDTYIGIVPLHIIRVLPLIVLVMYSFFKGIPKELEEAASIEGCTNFQIFINIIIPLSRPGIVAVAILSFIYSWNNLIFILVLGGPKTRTLPLAIFSFVSFEEILWGSITAAATIILLPVVIFAFLAQRHLIKGLTVGATKG